MKKIKKRSIKKTQSIPNHFHLKNVGNFAGFSVENVKSGRMAKILARALIVSDEPFFYKYIEQISSILLSKANVLTNSIYQFLILIHRDLTADLYVNNFPVQVEVCLRRSVDKGDPVMRNDIADIRRLNFPNIKIIETDKVIYCFKVGWKFGLFFDLNRQVNLDINTMSLDLGKLYRYLEFQYVYETLEIKERFEEMKSDGWFPFTEIIGNEYKTLSEAYQDRFDFENKISKVIDSFDPQRLTKLSTKWWGQKIFKDKQEILQAGIKAYTQNNKEGYIQCIKTLSSEVEGIIRLQYHSDTTKSKPTFKELLEYIVNKGKSKFGSDYSLFLPLSFFEYLRDVFFANFNLETGEVNLSRHTTSHGVAKAEDYTKIKALQTILVLDQIYFYIK